MPKASLMYSARKTSVQAKLPGVILRWGSPPTVLFTLMDTTSNAGELVAPTCASTLLQSEISTEMIHHVTSATGRIGCVISRGSLGRDNTEFCLTIIRREEKHSQMLIVSSHGRVYLFYQFL